MDSAKFARWVDAEIAKRGLRKQDFYKGSGISSATLSQWRTGLYTPSRSAIEKVEQFFNVTFDANLELLPEETKKDPAPDGAESKADVFMNLYASLSPEQQAKVEAFAKFLQMEGKE